MTASGPAWPSRRRGGWPSPGRTRAAPACAAVAGSPRCMRSVGERSSDLSRSLVGEQQEQEHTAIVLTTCRRRSLERRGLIRGVCRRDDRTRRSRDSAGGVAPGTQRKHGNENMGDDETELPRAFQATFSLASTHRRGVRIYSPPRVVQAARGGQERARATASGGRRAVSASRSRGGR